MIYKKFNIREQNYKKDFKEKLTKLLQRKKF